MATYWNNKTKVILLVILIILWGVMHVENVKSGTYLDSAHGGGGPGAGVNRSCIGGVGEPYATGYATGNCAHCHEKHASVGGAEPTPPISEGASLYSLFKDNYGMEKNELCYACHETFALGGMPLGYGRYGIYKGKTKYNASVHYSNINMVWPYPSIIGPTYDDAGNCHNCHNPHGYSDATGLIPHMLFLRDSKTGDNPNGEMGCIGCHDGSRAKDIKSLISVATNHTTALYNNRHTLPETGQSEGGSSFGPTNRHAECVDCHNPHTIGSINPNSPTIHPTVGVNRTSAGNLLNDTTFGSKALQGVWGVEVSSWPTSSVSPTQFTVGKPPTYPNGATKEYHICFKCHSYYGWGSGVSLAQDIASHFNPWACSGHPVIKTQNERWGGVAPKALIYSEMKDPWSANVGNTTMYCTDCHGNDAYGANDPQGPHGHARPDFLSDFTRNGQRYYWPTDEQGFNWSLYCLYPSNQGAPDCWHGKNEGYLLCAACHKINLGNDVHAKHYNSYEMGVCIYCHVTKIHGGRHSRLIGGSKVQGFRKKTFNNYQQNDCYSTDNTICGPHKMGYQGWDCTF